MVRNITGGVHGVCDRGIVRGRTDGMERDIDREGVSPCGGVSADGSLVRQTCRGDRYADALRKPSGRTSQKGGGINEHQ